MSLARSFDRDRPTDSGLIVGTLAFVALAVAGLFIVKWHPYWNKAHVAATTHAIGASIVSGKGIAPPAVGLEAAWRYSVAYFNSVWMAVTLALLLGSSIQVFVSRRWLVRLLGGRNTKSATAAGALSLGGMMCTCCAGPVVNGLRRQQASIGSSLAFFLGNPLLNPATLIFMGFVLGWQFSAMRLIASVALIATVVGIANRMTPEEPARAQIAGFVPAPIERPDRSLRTLSAAWLRELWGEMVAVLPGYAIIVFVLGGLRAWLFPVDFTVHASGMGATAVIALIGTLFVIPTAGEVPIVQTFLSHGMSLAAAVALLVTLPAISLPSLFIVRKAFPRKVLAMTFGVIFAGGIVAGTAAGLIHP